MDIDWGSIPKSAMRPVHKDGKRRINGRQVNVVIALGGDAGKHGDELLKYIQSCGFNLDKLEDIEDGDMLQQIVAKLKGGIVR